MFRSRVKRNVFIFLRGWLWPRKGHHRPWLYLRHRVARMPDTPHRIAAGFASGVAASITPFVGFHFILAGLLAWLLRGNIVASAVGTAIGNPWTFPLIWLGTYRLGAAFVGVEAETGITQRLSWDLLFMDPGAVLGPMLLGAAPIALLSWCVTYFAIRRFVAFYRERRELKKKSRLKTIDNGAAKAA